MPEALRAPPTVKALENSPLPTTSKAFDGIVVLIPIRLLLALTYKVFVSTVKLLLTVTLLENVALPPEAITKASVLEEGNN